MSIIGSNVDGLNRTAGKPRHPKHGKAAESEDDREQKTDDDPVDQESECAAAEAGQLDAVQL